MGGDRRIKIALGVVSGSLAVLLFLVVYICRRRSKKEESSERGRCELIEQAEKEDLICFAGCGGLTVQDILDAPGEVVGKSSYGTLYKATLVRNGSLVLLRFLRPACTGRMKEIFPAIQLLGFVRHPNLVSLDAFYSGTRGEKLLVHPFFSSGNLSQFLRDGKDEAERWPVIYRISLGIVKGLDYLHTGLPKPLIHGNLKSKNIFLDSDYEPYISDSGLHLLLNATAAQEMLEASAEQGYKAPELIKMKEASTESDIYSLGVILLEILTGKEPLLGAPLSLKNPHLPSSTRNAILDHKASEILSTKLLSQSDSLKRQHPVTEEDLLMFFQLAISCCSPSPSLRPDTKQIIRKLEQIG
ncbi:putative kinase-like protein TMKL1 [Aristolochia californica]|uniref:putative kinase-like protein TMKL1 n=1 Tax=Aristolochia californica TaxID=171875 RepID=UPI0035D53856